MKRLQTSKPRQLQERRIRWQHGLSRSRAGLIAQLHYGEARQ